jgi:hypothetical protein
MPRSEVILIPSENQLFDTLPEFDFVHSEIGG